MWPGKCEDSPEGDRQPERWTGPDHRAHCIWPDARDGQGAIAGARSDLSLRRTVSESD